MADRDKISDMAATMMVAACGAGDFETFCAAIDMLHGIAHSRRSDAASIIDALEVIVKAAATQRQWRV